MTTDELTQLAAEKAIKENSWESIEYLFRPSTMLELLLRLDFDGMVQKINDWAADMSPGAMPWRHRSPYTAQMSAAIKREEFYRKLVQLKEEQQLCGT